MHVVSTRQQINGRASCSHNRIFAFPPAPLHLIPLHPLHLELAQLRFGELQFRLQLLALNLQIRSSFGYAKLLGVQLDDLRGVRGARVAGNRLGVLAGKCL